MASNFLNALADKRYSPRSNDKADVISQRLREHKIALEVMAGHPDVLNEYVKAVNHHVDGLEGRTQK